MTCIHGLDEINCPTCRISISSIPKTDLKPKNPHENHLKPISLAFRQNSIEKEEFLKELRPNKIIEPHSINPIKKPTLLTDLPNFKNNKFQERLDEIDISKSDVFGISKKMPLESPEWKFEKED